MISIALKFYNPTFARYIRPVQLGMYIKFYGTITGLFSVSFRVCSRFILTCKQTCVCDDLALCCPFLHIFRLGKLQVVKYLIEVQGCSAECTDIFGKTLLHQACR